MSTTNMLSYMRVLDPEFNCERHTLSRHKNDHLTSPLVSASEKTKREGPRIVPKSNRAYLEMVRDQSAQAIIEHPELITVDHGIKAATELEKQSVGPADLWAAFAMIQAGRSPEIIVGEFKQLDTEEEPEQEAVVQA